MDDKVSQVPAQARRGMMIRLWGNGRFALLLVSCVLAFGPVGCGDSESGATDQKPGDIVTSPEDPVDFSEIAAAFETSDTVMKFSVNEVLAVIRAGAYGDARAQLLRLAQDPRLTPAQKQAVENLAGKLQNMRNRPR